MFYVVNLLTNNCTLFSALILGNKYLSKML